MPHPPISNTFTEMLYDPPMLLTPQHSAPSQSTDLIGGISASPSIYKLCIVVTHFIFFFPEYSTQGHDYLSTCVMETFPP